MTSAEILKVLRANHPDDRGWAFVEELRVGTGYGAENEQRIDAWAINLWPTRFRDAPLLRRSFEVKTSRSDFERELRNPDKRWYAKVVSHQFFFVAPAGLISSSELDEDDGLIEVNETGIATFVVTPPPRACMPPKWAFVASLARRVK